MKWPNASQVAEVWSRLFDLLFGYDCFLAHRSKDGKEYALALYEALTGKGNELDCFLDVKHYGAGGNLTAMQTRALRKTSRLILIVTPRAHDAAAVYLRKEINEFKQLHPKGVIVPIGSWQTLSDGGHVNSELLRLLPHLPNDICIVESPADLENGTPSAQAVSKLLNDFSEERRSTKRLRWIRRVALLLLLFLLAAIGFAASAVREAAQVRRQLQIAEAQRLTAEAVNLQDYSPGRSELAILLAAEACKRSPSVQTTEALRQGVALLPASGGVLDHGVPIRSAAFSPDGWSCATGGKDGRIKLWDIFAGTQSGSDIRWNQTNDDVFALNNEGQIAVAEGTTVRIISPNRAEELTITNSSPSPIFDVGLSFSGRYLYALSRAAPGFPSDFCLWEITNTSSTSKIHINGSGNNYPDTVVFSPSEKNLAIKPLNGPPQIWDLETGKLDPPLDSQSDNAVSMAFSDDGLKFAAGDFGGQVQVWTLENGKELDRLKCGWACTALSFSHDGNELAAGSESEVRLINFRNKDEIVFLPHTTVVNNVLFSPGNQFLATHSQDGTWRIWNVARKTEVNRVSNQPDAAACFSPDGRLVTAKFGANRVETWRVGPGDVLCQVSKGTGDSVACLAPDNQYLAAASPGDNRMRVWKIGGMNNHMAFQGSGADMIAFSVPAKCMVACRRGYSWQGDLGKETFDVYDLAAAKEIAKVDYPVTVPGTSAMSSNRPPRFPDLHITALALSPTGEHLAAASSDGTLLVAHLPDGRKEFAQKTTHAAALMTFTGPDRLSLVDSEGDVLAFLLSSQQLSTVAHYGKGKKPLAISENGKLLAVVGTNSQVQVEDIENNRNIFQFRSGPVWAAAFGGDGRYLAASQYATDSRYTTVSVWDTTTHLQVANITQGLPAAGISFSNDSRYLVLAGSPSTVQLWQTSDLLQIAEQHLSRNLSPDEWSLFIGNEPYRKTFQNLP